jgi:hypothetical protein
MMKLIHGILSTALVMLFGLSTPVHAVTPAGSLSLTVEVTHSGLAPGAEPNKVSAGVTFPLIPAAPDLSAPVNQQQEVNENETIDITYSYTVTSMANGPDLYLLRIMGGSLVNVPVQPILKLRDHQPGSGSWEISGGQTQEITLGATALSVDAQANSQEVSPELIVPSDGTADDTVNEIQAGDKVVIENTVYDVIGVVDDGVTGKITLGAPLAQDASVGTLIAEQQAFDMLLFGANVDDPTLPATYRISVIAKTAASAMGEGDIHETLTSVYRPTEAEFAIYVRNVTSPIAASSVAYTSISGQEYFDTGIVQTSPGEIVEYALVQTAGSGPALTGVEFKTNIPAFMVYEDGSTILNNDKPVADIEGNSPLIAGMAVSSPGSAAGTIASFSFAEVTFKLKMDESTVKEASETELPSHTLWVSGTTDKDVCWETEVCDSWPYGTCLIESPMCNDYGCWVEGTSSIGFTQLASVFSYIEAEGATNFYTTFGNTSGTTGIDRDAIFCID